MKNIVSFSLIAAGFVLAAPGLSAKAASAGSVDFGSFAATGNGQVVEVKLEPALIKFAAKIAAVKEPEAAELLKNIEHVRVNVVELDETNTADATARIAAVRTQLESAGWAPTVSVRDPKKGDDVVVYIKTGADDCIEGIVVTVIEDKKQAVFVNVVGSIRPEQLAELGKRLDIDVLKRPELKTAKAPVAQP
ncbi:MAG: DUF4252 domain-containing protein [Opitutaceae bacterium]|nr:DUF4252 domain-containing protein [Opitutaceae bacterium]